MADTLATTLASSGEFGRFVEFGRVVFESVAEGYRYGFALGRFPRYPFDFGGSEDKIMGKVRDVLWLWTLQVQAPDVVESNRRVSVSVSVSHCQCHTIMISELQ